MATTSPSAEAAPATKRRRRLPVLAAVLAAVLTIGGGAAFFLLRSGAVHATAPASAQTVKPVKPVFVTLERLTVNLLSDGKPKFLHIGVSLRAQDEEAKARLLEVMPELRSRLLLLLSNRDPATLAKPADKAALAEQIRTELNRPLASGAPAQGIAGVAFDAFVVQ